MVLPSRAKDRWQGTWFPLSLAILLLLTVPGMVLLFINLIGQQAAVNGWLRERFGITYLIVLPSWAALLLLLTPFLIVLLYFLKMKRKPLHVPSTFLWRKSIEDLQVNSLFQWLRDNVLLLIQLLIVLFLIYAAMSFQWHRGTGSGRYYILILDSSASMAATDVQPNRLDVARREALQEIDRHDDADPGMVIEFNSRASILQPYTNDKGLLRSAVKRIMQTQRLTRIEEALSLADSLANPRHSTDDVASRPQDEDPAKARTYVAGAGISAEVHLFTDGGFSDGTAFAAGNLDLHYHRIGSTGPVDNVGLVSLNAVRDPQEPAKVQVFARILNFRKDPVVTRLELQWRVWGKDDFKIKDQEVAIKARVVTPADPDKNEPAVNSPGEAVVTLSLPDLEEGNLAVLHARLVGLKDAFPLDDQAWLVLGVLRKARVLIVTPGNKVLRHFFDQEATSKVANVQYLAPSDLDDDAKYGKPAREGRFDLVIFDRCAPKKEENLPLGNTFFIDSVPPPWKRSTMMPLDHVQIRNPTSKHPLMQNLTALDEIAFTEAFRFELGPAKNPGVPPRTPRLLETDKETAVLFALSRRSFTDLVLAFPLVNARGEWTTTWNLKLSFPVFLRNVLYQLGNVSDASSEETAPPGEVKVVRPDGAVKEVLVKSPGDPAGSLVHRNAQGHFVFQDTEQLGIYTAKWDGGEQAFAVNLLDPQESDIEPREVVHLGAQDLKAGPSRGQPRETWKWWALGALLLLATEWFLYHRR
jgi:von Willebrand factor type A domain/Aerotolerance regulator N-terminal